MHVFVKSYGCSANLADGEVLSGCLAKAGYKLAVSVSEADIAVYNTCAVKGPTENPSESSVEIGNLALGIIDDHGIGGRFHESSVPRFGMAQCVFRLLALGCFHAQGYHLGNELGKFAFGALPDSFRFRVLV